MSGKLWGALLLKWKWEFFCEQTEKGIVTKFSWMKGVLIVGQYDRIGTIYWLGLDQF